MSQMPEENGWYWVAWHKGDNSEPVYLWHSTEGRVFFTYDVDEDAHWEELEPEELLTSGTSWWPDDGHFMRKWGHVPPPKL